MRNNFSNIYHYVKYLSFAQLYYFSTKRLRDTFFKIYLNDNVHEKYLKNVAFLSFLEENTIQSTKISTKNFTFLNKTVNFHSGIDWNHIKHGLLWNYNLLYFDYINTSYLTKESSLDIINDFISNYNSINYAYAPYPASLRIYNWIKFLSRHKVNISAINHSLYIQSRHLFYTMEFYLKGNHLIENCFSIILAGFYFNCKKFIKKGISVLTKQLDNQILEDGAHFEKSPTYHMLILYKLIELLYISSNNKANQIEEASFKSYQSHAEKMLGWINQITFKNGEYPRFNDIYGNNFPYSLICLNRNAELVDIYPSECKLKDSGYRKTTYNNYQIVVNIGSYGDTYLPGHIHDDTFNFELYINDNPLIVDTGTSTYENNKFRIEQRSTFSHNTVQIGTENQSKLWSNFRVGKRANVKILRDDSKEIEGYVIGFKSFKEVHKRKFIFSTNFVEIEDTIESKYNTIGKSFLHFHPSINIKLVDDKVVAGAATISVSGHDSMIIEKYQYCCGFNNTVESKKLTIFFEKNCTSKIYINLK